MMMPRHTDIPRVGLLVRDWVVRQPVEGRTDQAHKFQRLHPRVLDVWGVPWIWRIRCFSRGMPQQSLAAGHAVIRPVCGWRLPCNQYMDRKIGVDLATDFTNDPLLYRASVQDMQHGYSWS